MVKGSGCTEGEEVMKGLLVPKLNMVIIKLLVVWNLSGCSGRREECCVLWGWQEGCCSLFDWLFCFLFVCVLTCAVFICSDYKVIFNNQKSLSLSLTHTII